MKTSWRQIQRHNFVRLSHLADFLELPKDAFIDKSTFPLNLPKRLAEKIVKGDINDPILKQFLPAPDENTSVKGFKADPVGDLSAIKSPRLLHKYEGRALLITTGACAMHCRYCFRQNFPYGEGDKALNTELELIATDSSIEEVLLSGGDPLSLSNESLKKITDRLSEIHHVKRIRIHSRFPVGIPERVDEEFLRLIKSLPQSIIFVVHCNHPREIDDDVGAAFKKLQQAGALVLNQSVLLRGVNDSVQVLAELSKRLVEFSVLPYYLHQLDKVEGSAHFEVPKEEGLKLVSKLQTQVPGYFVPRYVQEIEGEPSKTEITSSRRF